MGVLSFRAPQKFAVGVGYGGSAPVALAAAFWVVVVAALFAAWLITETTRENSGAYCESFGRGGERCAPAAASASVCSSLERGGRLCVNR
jgi:hypothetical protein